MHNNYNNNNNNHRKNRFKHSNFKSNTNNFNNSNSNYNNKGKSENELVALCKEMCPDDEFHLRTNNNLVNVLEKQIIKLVLFSFVLL